MIKTASAYATLIAACGTALYVMAPTAYPSTPGFINHVSYQVEDFCSATSVEDTNLEDGLQGVFLTAAHCVEGVGKVYTIHNQYGTYKAIVTDYNKETDLAVLSSLKPLDMEIDTAKIGLDISFGEHIRSAGYAFGFPMKYYTEGYVAENFSVEGYNKTYASLSAAGGQSGSGVFNDAGELIGVLQAGMQTQMESQSTYSLLATLEEIREILGPDPIKI